MGGLDIGVYVKAKAFHCQMFKGTIDYVGFF